MRSSAKNVGRARVRPHAQGSVDSWVGVDHAGGGDRRVRLRGPHPAGAPTGALCLAVEDCFPEIDHALLGTVFCEDKFEDGYCTHTCETDEDCCAIDGECAPRIAHVCTPLADDETDALGGADPAAYCFMGAGCRSSGGGSENCDICLPP